MEITTDFDIKRRIDVFFTRPGIQLVIECWWLYKASDPLAVQMMMMSPAGALVEPVVWSLSRDVLTDAVMAGTTAGDGDFIIEVNTSRAIQAVCASRIPTNGGETMLMHMNGLEDTPEGPVQHHSHAHIGRDMLGDFLDETFALVPLGDEKYDIDAVIEKLLA